MNNLEFQSIKKMVFDLKKNELCEANSELNLSKVAGIYLVYINEFSDDKILPIYIGQTDNIHRRYGEHFKELMALNRLNKEIYQKYHNELFYNGSYKTCKIFKYMVDHQCTLNDFHIVLLEMCDVSELDKKEKEYINKFKSKYFGFNQLETISGLIKPEYSDMPTAEKRALIIEELMMLDRYLDYGFNKFNYILAFGLLDNKEDDGITRSMKKKIRERIIDVDSVPKEAIEDSDIYRKRMQQIHRDAVIKYLIPSMEYIDFPLKKYIINPQFPKLKNYESGIYFVISNTNRCYGDTNYQAEIVKIIVKHTTDKGEVSQLYYIENDSFNLTYYEKDYGKSFILRKNPFKITTSYDFIHMISLSTELKTGVNDYELRNKQLWKLNDAINDIIHNITDGNHFKLVSNQSKEVMYDCLLAISYTMRLRLENKKLEEVNLESLNLLIINNDCFKEKYYKTIFSDECIKTRRINDYARGIKMALEGEYDYIVFQVNRANDHSLTAIRNLRELNRDIQIMVVNHAGVKGHRIIEEISNVIIFDSTVKINVLMDIFIDYIDRKKAHQIKSIDYFSY